MIFFVKVEKYLHCWEKIYKIKNQHIALPFSGLPCIFFACAIHPYVKNSQYNAKIPQWKSQKQKNKSLKMEHIWIISL